MDISRGRIIANFIDVSSVLDISRGRIIANFIDVSSVLDISRGRIKANNIDVSSIVVSSTIDISRGTILANTISGSAIIINLNANASSDIITINIGISNGVKINTATTSNANAITINGVRLATTQHIKNVIPYGVIMAYYSTPAPPGWAICDGSNGTPDLRGKFILGGGIKAGGTGGIISSDNSYIYHTFLTDGTFSPTEITSVKLIVVGGGGSGASYINGTENYGTVGGKGGTVTDLSAFDVTIDQSYSVTIGSGGVPSSGGSPGGDSSFYNITAPGGNRTSLNIRSDGTLVNIFNTSYYMGGDGGGVYFPNNTYINGGKGGGGGSGNAFGFGNLYISGKGGEGGINPGGDGQTSIGGNGGANTGGGGGGVYTNDGTPGRGGSGIVIVYYPHTSISSNGSNRLTPRPIGVSGGEENTRLNLTNIPAHGHNYNFTENDITGNTPAPAIRIVSNSDNLRQDGAVYSVGGTGLGLAVPHNNMPPFYVLIYIMKTSYYDFCYNLVA